MASLGDLVVNLTAKTGSFERGMGKASGIMSDFAATATLAAGTAVGGGLIKLAADAESLAVKFKVLLGSAAQTATMMREISRFAAETPFQKMDIAGAAQKLLAFNVPAKEVMDVLKNIGDISALTGNRIGELAEIYGKAQVQGRLFMEDINQLTGRGIPIIQELAKQFGVAESEVRNLVSAGKVTAANITTAFKDMTTGGGKFAGGMKELSTTTAGQFSTLVDNVKELGASMGKSLLPMANKVLSTITGLVKMSQGWGGMLLKVGAAIMGFALAVKATSLALRAYAQAQAVAQAFSGKQGWVRLGIGAIGATAAVYGIDAALKDVGQSLPEFNAAVEQGEQQTRHMAEVFNSAVEPANKFNTSIEQVKATIASLAPPTERVRSAIAQFQEDLSKVPGIGLGQGFDLTKAFTEKESGFTDKFTEMRDELKILKGEATKTGIALQAMLDAGVDPSKVQELKDMMAERDRILQQQEAKEYWARREEQERDRQKKQLAATPTTAGFQAQGSEAALKSILGAMGNKKKDPLQQAQLNELEGMHEALEAEANKPTHKIWFQGAV